MATHLQEAEMRARVLTRLFLSIVFLSASFLPTGCSGGAATRPDSLAVGPQVPPVPKVSLNAETRTEAAKPFDDRQAEDLAAQAELDVQDFLAMRQAAVDKAEPAVDAMDLQPPPPTIVWNDAGSIHPAPGASGVDLESLESEVNQSPLFRDPVESVEVEGLAADGSNPGAIGADALSPDKLKQLIVNLRRELYQQSIDSNQPLKELIPLAAMALVDPELDLKPEYLRQLTDEEKVLLEELQAFFADMGGSLDDSNEAPDVIGDAVLNLHTAIAKKPSLDLPVTALCWRVGGFGDYDCFDRYAWVAHTEQRVILYMEIDRFTSELNKNEQWVTELSQQLEIIADRDGIPVWSEPWQKAPDVSNQKRKDFFTTQILTLPQALSVGKYQLKIRVRDEKSGAEHDASIEFEMVADSKLAAKIPK